MGGGSKQQEQPTQTTSYQLSPEQRQLMNLAMPGIAQFAAQTPQRYQGEQVAPFTGTQQQAQQSAVTAAGTQQGIADQAAGVYGSIPGRLKDYQATGGINVSPEQWAAAQPTLNSAITAATNPIYENLTEAALPAIRGTGIGTSGLTTGGTRQGVAEGIAAGKASRAAGDVGATMANQELQALQNLNQQRYATDVAGEGQRYGQNLSALYQMLGLTPQIQAAQAQPAATLGAVGDVQQAMDQAKINEAMSNFNFDQYGNYLKSKDILSLLQGLPGGSTVSTANNPPQAPIGQQALGGALTGAQMGSMFGPMGMGIGAAGGAIMPFLFK